MFIVQVLNHKGVWYSLPGIHSVYRQAYNALQCHLIKVLDSYPNDLGLSLRIKNETTGQCIDGNDLHRTLMDCGYVYAPYIPLEEAKDVEKDDKEIEPKIDWFEEAF
ncbi:MAG: hypothetical protein M0R80_08410 [Proteobacteria bacterium]|jgi:hypothetical protein|nr:hypothetical protein [Pseudomonadota bacterium]